MGDILIGECTVTKNYHRPRQRFVVILFYKQKKRLKEKSFGFCVRQKLICFS